MKWSFVVLLVLCLLGDNRLHEGLL